MKVVPTTDEIEIFIDAAIVSARWSRGLLLGGITAPVLLQKRAATTIVGWRLCSGPGFMVKSRGTKAPISSPTRAVRGSLLTIRHLARLGSSPLVTQRRPFVEK